MEENSHQIYMTIEGLSGDIQEKSLDDSIAVEQVDFAFNYPVHTHHPLYSGFEAKETTGTPVVVSGLFAKDTLLILQRFWKRKEISLIRLSWLNRHGTYWQTDFTKALISHVSVIGAGNTPEARITFQYCEFVSKFTPEVVTPGLAAGVINMKFSQPDKGRCQGQEVAVLEENDKALEEYYTNKVVEKKGEPENRKLAEVLFIPGTEEICLLTKEQLEEFQAEESVLSDLSRNLRDAREEQDAEKTEKAADEVAAALTTLAEGSGMDNITEVIRLKKGKTGWVRNGFMKRFGADKHTLKQEYHRKSLFTKKEGKLKTARLKEQFSQNVNKLVIKGNWASESLVGEENAFAHWVEGVNESLQYSSSKNKKDLSEVHFDTSAQAQLMRFYANGALESQASFREMKLGVHGQINITAAFAEGVIRSSAYWPNKEGHSLSFDMPSKKDGNLKTFELGNVRALLEIVGQGQVAASVVGSVDLEFNLKPEEQKKGDKTGSRLGFRGFKSGKDGKANGNSVSGKFFAGVEIGGEVNGKCQWDNPEKRKEDGQPVWCDFVSVGYGLKGAVGFGGELDVSIRYRRGKIEFRARAGIILGLGAGGGIVGAVDAGNLYQFVQFVYHRLKDCDFGFLDFMEQDVFISLTFLSVKVIEEGKKFIQLVEHAWKDIDESIEGLAKAINDIEQWWFGRRILQDEVENLAKRILRRPEEIKYTTPEAKGILIDKLCHSFETSFDELQEEAIVCILEHVQSRREYRKICEHLNPNGTRQDYLAGHYRISNMLDLSESIRFFKLQHRWDGVPIQNWKAEGESIFSEKPETDQAVKIASYLKPKDFYVV